MKKAAKNPPIFLDYNSTTPLDPRVLEEVLPLFTEHFGNPSSTTHPYGWQAAELVEIARERIAQTINCDPSEIYFTSGATESNNLAIKGVAFSHFEKTSQPLHLITPETEHKAVLDPINYLAAQGFRKSNLTTNSSGQISSEELETLAKEEDCLISIMLANNETGVVCDITELSKARDNSSTVFHCDATQALGKVNVDVKKLGADLISFSGHKAYAPKGIGLLYINSKSTNKYITPLLHGGNHENGIRSGTLNTPAIVGLGKACEIINNDLSSDTKRITKLTKLFIHKLKESGCSFQINGEHSQRIPGTLNLAFSGADNAKLIGKLSNALAISAGSACNSASRSPSHVLKAMGISDERAGSSIRISLGRFTTQPEVVQAAKLLLNALKTTECFHGR